MRNNIAKKVEAIREELRKPIPEHLITKEKANMAAKKPAAKKRPAAKKKAPAKKTADSNVVSLSDLAEQAGISPQQARAKLRNAGIERPDGQRWGWPPKSKGLTAAKKALGI